MSRKIAHCIECGVQLTDPRNIRCAVHNRRYLNMKRWQYANGVSTLEELRVTEANELIECYEVGIQRGIIESVFAKSRIEAIRAQYLSNEKKR